MKQVGVLLAVVIVLALSGFATGVDLIAGQFYEAGWVEANATRELLVIEIYAENGWALEETHVYVGTEAPTKSAPGRFPFKHEKLDGAVSDAYVIDLSDYDVDCSSDLFIAVHAVVYGAENDYGEETAWGEGDFIRSGKNWAMYFMTPVRCETR